MRTVIRVDKIVGGYLSTIFRLKSWIRLNNARIIYQDDDSVFFSREGHTGRAKPSPVRA